MIIDYNLIATIFFGTAPGACAFLLYLHKMDKQLSILKNDVQWLKLKACQRREVDFKHLVDEDR